jgi:hypothetical protein
MDGSTGLLSVDAPCNEVLLRVRRSLERVGLRLLETFDLQVARSSGAECPCPHHGTAKCDCQMIVLLIYGEGTAPTALMLHGSDGRTWISLPDSPACGTEPLIEAAIVSGLGDRQPAEGL